jgi:hypothetical protein
MSRTEIRTTADFNKQILFFLYFLRNFEKERNKQNTKTKIMQKIQNKIERESQSVITQNKTEELKGGNK